MRRKPNIEPPDEPRPQRSRKDRKRWCGGKVGVEHDPEWVDSWVAWGKVHTPQQAEWAKTHTGFGWEIQICRRCGKRMGWRKKNA